MAYYKDNQIGIPSVHPLSAAAVLRVGIMSCNVIFNINNRRSVNGTDIIFFFSQWDSSGRISAGGACSIINVIIRVSDGTAADSHNTRFVHENVKCQERRTFLRSECIHEEAII